MSTTFQEIIDRAKSRVDMSESDFVSAGDWLEFARDAYRSLYNVLVTSFQDYFLTTSSNLTVSSTGTVSVPSDFQRLHAVDMLEGSDWTSVWPGQFNERNGFRNSVGIVFRRNDKVRYRLISGSVYFYPAELASAKTVRLWYTPLPAKIVAVSTIPTEMEQWSRHMVLDAAIMALVKEESDPSALMAELDRIRMDIQGEVMNRDMQRVDRIRDVNSAYDSDDWGY